MTVRDHLRGTRNSGTKICYDTATKKFVYAWDVWTREIKAIKHHRQLGTVICV